MKFLQHIKRVFSKLTPAEVIATELAEAELSRLEHQTAVDFSESMVAYNDKRIARLRQHLQQESA